MSCSLLDDVIELSTSAHVSEWTEEIARFPRDPLVVGYQSGDLYLIDKFDTTTVEGLAAREFTTDEMVESRRDHPSV